MSGGAEVLDAYGEEKVSEARAAGIPGLCEILSSSSEGVRMTAARMLCALCDSTTVGHSDARKEFRDAGGIPVLVMTLGALHPLTLQWASRTLCNLAKDAQLVDVLIRFGVSQKLPALLLSEVDTTRKAICHAIALLCTSDANRSALAAEGLVSPLLRLLHDHDIAPRLKKYAAGALCALALCADVAIMMGKAGGITELVQVLDVTHPGPGSRGLSQTDASMVRAAIVSVLCNLALYEENREYLVAVGGIEKLVLCLDADSNSLIVQQAAAMTFANLAGGKKAGVISDSTLRHLVALLDSSSHGPVKMDVMQCIINLASSDETKVALAVCGGIDVILRLLDSADAKVQGAAEDTLKALAIDDNIYCVTGRVPLDILLQQHNRPALSSFQLGGEASSLYTMAEDAHEAITRSESPDPSLAALVSSWDRKKTQSSVRPPSQLEVRRSLTPAELTDTLPRDTGLMSDTDWATRKKGVFHRDLYKERLAEMEQTLTDFRLANDDLQAVHNSIEAGQPNVPEPLAKPLAPAPVLQPEPMLAMSKDEVLVDNRRLVADRSQRMVASSASSHASERSRLRSDLDRNAPNSAFAAGMSSRSITKDSSLQKEEEWRAPQETTSRHRSHELAFFLKDVGGKSAAASSYGSSMGSRPSSGSSSLNRASVYGSSADSRPAARHASATLAPVLVDSDDDSDLMDIRRQLAEMKVQRDAKYQVTLENMASPLRKTGYEKTGSVTR